MKKLLCVLVVVCVSSLSYAQSYDINGDGNVNSGDVVALYNYIESGGTSELTKDDVVGTWKVMYYEWSRWVNDVLEEEGKEDMEEEEENDFYVFYADNKISYLEEINADGEWSVDGTLIYSLYNGKFYVLGGDLDSFKLLEVGGDQMLIEEVYEEDKSYDEENPYLVRQRVLIKLVRVSKETDILPINPNY